MYTKTYGKIYSFHVFTYSFFIGNIQMNLLDFYVRVRAFEKRVTWKTALNHCTTLQT